jgi:hypothetical protein
MGSLYSIRMLLFKNWPKKCIPRIWNQDLFKKFIIIAKKASKSDSKGTVVFVLNKPIVSDVSLDDHVFHVDGR